MEARSFLYILRSNINLYSFYILLISTPNKFIDLSQKTFPAVARRIIAFIFYVIPIFHLPLIH
jgi:hypothetical protein